MHTERYRSGHNEAVLKTVCPQGHVGSNPTLSVIFLLKINRVENIDKIHGVNLIFFANIPSMLIRRSTQAGRRDTPGKGAGR